MAFKDRQLNGKGSGCEVDKFFERVGVDFICTEAKPTALLCDEILSTRVSKLISEVKLFEMRPRK